MKEKIEKIFEECLGRKIDITSIDKLHGDASYRTYFRVALKDGSTYILMQMPTGKSSVSEEITNFKGSQEEPPFINVAAYLGKLGLPVPKVLAYDETERLMVLEDLGDGLMARQIENTGDDERLAWYKKAIDLIIKLQRETSKQRDETCVAFKRSFDSTLLNWEFDHFLEYAVTARLGKTLSQGELATFNKETRIISKKIEAMPSGFTHRDFQSRNLIVKEGTLHLIDFQDALQGPYVYDLVSLTRDSYVALSEAMRKELVAYYASATGWSLGRLGEDYDLVTVQRKLKDAGRFVYIDRVKGNPNFLKFIPASLGYVKEALERLPKHKTLFELIGKYTPEWR